MATWGREGGSWVIYLLLGIVLIASVTSPVAGQQREPGYGVVSVGPHDGWYTAEQADRGADAYREHCARCHGVQLEGVIGLSPPLSGPRFLNRWQHESLYRLFSFVSAEMPFDMPAALDDHTYIDIIAYVLLENGLPEGSDELRPDRHQLGNVIIPPPGLTEDAADGPRPKRRRTLPRTRAPGRSW
jgi:hypothetical protein